MARPKDLVRLRHMLEATQKMLEFTKDRTRCSLDEDEMLTLALLRLLEILGEAAKGVSSELRQTYPQIPWKQLAGTRDRLIHGYFDVDLDIIWTIISRDLPPLLAELEKIASLEDG
ncbi:MAG: DUF86 domain-containing protein [Deltaproteobacteria bacterium]|nr:DUF86 domain-containing protein [Deltaproteobacteria bacterium]MBW1987119.1 DUF86 domain-containing protein [Deltaproteobacteria bacterium]MBW2135827.1 DUF86 domain-containing protein [Deltaproteobacteria bacterium]OPX18829.1 MAG: hypothetical protein BZ151_12525 [Desulfobacca sp. 4484_104]RLA87596.1 MAG: hypothetical protein DRG58_10365 [Deltaproteobacteria bacterium]